MSHRPRERHARAHPVHVTLRARRGLPPLRDRGLHRITTEAIAGANASHGLRGAFRIVHFSVQNDHIHLIVEACDKSALARGVQGLCVRLARRINGALGVRGRVWGDRFHSRELTTPRAVRHAIVYVLMNAKKHGLRIAGIDPFSSAPWFGGFVGRHDEARANAPVLGAGTWLASVGWRRYGLVRFDERPHAPQ